MYAALLLLVLLVAWVRFDLATSRQRVYSYNIWNHLNQYGIDGFLSCGVVVCFLNIASMRFWISAGSDEIFKA